MQCRFSFKHMKSSQALIDYATEKAEQKIEKYASKPIEAHITFSVEGRDHIAHCNVIGGDGFNIQVEAGCEDMYGTIDLLVDKLEIQLKRQKEKLKSHKHQIGLHHLQLKEVTSDEDYETVPVDAKDLLKFEKARKAAGSR